MLGRARRGCDGEPAEPVDLDDRGVAEVRVHVRRARNRRRAGAGSGSAAGPTNHCVAGAGELDADLDAVAREHGQQGRAGHGPRRTRARASPPPSRRSATNWWLKSMKSRTSGEQVLAERRERQLACTRACAWWHSSPRSSASACSAIRSIGPAARQRGAQLRAEHVAHPLQPRHDLAVVGAVAQDLPRALVERAPGGLPGRLVARDEQRHRAGDDARHRADAAGVVVREDRRPRRRRRARAPPPGCRRAPRSSWRRRARRASAGTCAAGAIGGPAWETPPAARWGTTSRAGTTSTSSGVACARAATAGSVYNVAFTAPMLRASARRSRHGHQGRKNARFRLDMWPDSPKFVWPG